MFVPAGFVLALRPFPQTPWLRDLFHHFADLRFLRRSGDIRLRNDSDQPIVAVDDRDAANLIVGHTLHGPHHVVLFGNSDWIGTHDAVDAGTQRIATLGHYAQGDIAIGNDTSQLHAGVVGDYRNRAHVLLFHNPCRRRG